MISASQAITVMDCDMDMHQVMDITMVITIMVMANTGGMDIKIRLPVIIMKNKKFLSRCNHPITQSLNHSIIQWIYRYR